MHIPGLWELTNQSVFFRRGRLLKRQALKQSVQTGRIEVLQRTNSCLSQIPSCTTCWFPNRTAAPLCFSKYIYKVFCHSKAPFWNHLDVMSVCDEKHYPAGSSVPVKGTHLLCWKTHIATPPAQNFQRYSSTGSWRLSLVNYQDVKKVGRRLMSVQNFLTIHRTVVEIFHQIIVMKNVIEGVCSVISK